ncbi:crossover junction endodeoxyribonuclease RuvC [Planctomicrobium piriforme]|uniref:Crossover junction endodeoxyribonuclease RuvC n=1 Tax=Planctomicrobium piriforme TaxID=1576369 RepID=A0A1I3LA28_9PLAN|nr:crossover junction endodeoxyribonuclease RuvC [Planctomicrobium piriforme]SFI81316.1 crossover junction endodeoxyribonuclease RuvC [Planctomicrobium piriforme]
MLNSAAPPVPEQDAPAAASTGACRRTSGVGMSLGNTFAGARGTVYLGIDPGLNRTGYALLRRGPRPILLEGGVISSRPKTSLAERVREIGDGIRELIEEFSPDAVAIEQLFSMPRNPRTAILMAHARGAILFAVANSERPVVNYSPRQVKKLLTGSGTASKEQVQMAIQRELGLASILEPNDVADACAIALCHYHSLRCALV